VQKLHAIVIMSRNSKILTKYRVHPYLTNIFFRIELQMRSLIFTVDSTVQNDFNRFELFSLKSTSHFKSNSKKRYGTSHESILISWDLVL
jgi:hypothetical protein